MEKVLLAFGSPLEISVAVARTSQSPFPLVASKTDTVQNERDSNKRYLAKPTY